MSCGPSSSARAGNHSRRAALPARPDRCPKGLLPAFWGQQDCLSRILHCNNRAAWACTGQYPLPARQKRMMLSQIPMFSAPPKGVHDRQHGVCHERDSLVRICTFERNYEWPCKSTFCTAIYQPFRFYSGLRARMTSRLTACSTQCSSGSVVTISKPARSHMRSRSARLVT